MKYVDLVAIAVVLCFGYAVARLVTCADNVEIVVVFGLGNVIAVTGLAHVSFFVRFVENIHVEIVIHLFIVFVCFDFHALFAEKLKRLIVFFFGEIARVEIFLRFSQECVLGAVVCKHKPHDAICEHAGRLVALGGVCTDRRHLQCAGFRISESRDHAGFAVLFKLQSALEKEHIDRVFSGNISQRCFYLKFISVNRNRFIHSNADYAVMFFCKRTERYYCCYHKYAQNKTHDFCGIFSVLNCKYDSCCRYCHKHCKKHKTRVSRLRIGLAAGVITRVVIIIRRFYC